MSIGIGSPIFDLASLPGASRPGGGGSGSVVDPVPFMYKTKVESGVQTDTGIFRIKKTGGDLTIDWGDGSTTTITAATNQNTLLHTYNDGTNTDVENPVVKIGAEGETGILTEIYYQASTTNFAADLLEIQQWGTKHAFTSLNFSNSTQMQLTATDALTTTNLNSTFLNCTAMTGNSSMNSWDTSNVTSFNATFQGCTNFNQDLYNWDVSSGTTHRNMFYANTNFNGNINGWAFTSSTLMSNMFTFASSFNQPVDNWDLTGTSKSLLKIFFDTTSFSQDISNWDVSKVTSFNAAFEGSTMNSDLSSWVLTEATTLTRMFYDNTSFNQDIGSMTLGPNLTSVYRMFRQTDEGATGMSNSNWTSTIVGWATQVNDNDGPQNVDGSEIATNTNLEFDDSASGGSKFSSAGEARDYLVEEAGWTITGDTRV